MSLICPKMCKNCWYSGMPLCRTPIWRKTRYLEENSRSPGKIHVISKFLGFLSRSFLWENTGNVPYKIINKISAFEFFIEQRIFIDKSRRKLPDFFFKKKAIPTYMCFILTILIIKIKRFDFVVTIISKDSLCRIFFLQNSSMPKSNMTKNSLCRIFLPVPSTST